MDTFSERQRLNRSILAADKDPRTRWADLLAMQFAGWDGKHLARSMGRRLAVLDDDECSIEDQATDREMVSVLAIGRARLVVFELDLGIAVSHEFCFEASGVGCGAHVDARPLAMRSEAILHTMY